MNTYIALFRGINVGGKHILPMQDLAEILHRLGCHDIQTYIQSGNVIFRGTETSASTLAQQISVEVSKLCGFAPKVLLLKVPELEAAINNNSFPTDDGKALHFFFMEQVPDSPKLDNLITLKKPNEDFRLHRNVFYLYAPDGIGRSKLAEKVEYNLGVPVMARNWNTVSKLLAMVS